MKEVLGSIQVLWDSKNGERQEEEGERMGRGEERRGEETVNVKVLGSSAPLYSFLMVPCIF